MNCPHCDAEVPDGARSCLECGSDEQTGWAAHAEIPLSSSGPAEPRSDRSTAAVRVAALVMVGVLLAVFATPLAGVIAVVLLVAGHVAWKAWSRSPRHAERRARVELLRRVQGDEALADRLVLGRRQAHPHESADQSIRRVIDQLDRDRR
jgi:hypothetical protein